MQANNETKTIHIKTVLNNEFRRFSLDKANFSKLEGTIRTLYSLAPTQQLRVCFIDDEKDEVLMSSDEEFLYAVDLVQPVRLVVTLIDSVLPPSTKTVDFDAPDVATVPHEFKFRCGRKETLTKEERIVFKTARISQRIKHIEDLLLTDLPTHREQTLNWKLTKLQTKLETLQSTPEQITLNTPTPLSTTASVTENPGVISHGRRGGRGRGGERGCHGGPMTFEKSQNVEGCGRKWGKCEDKKWENVRAARMNFCAARRSGNQDEIEKCAQLLADAKQLAKADWQQKKNGETQMFGKMP